MVRKLKPKERKLIVRILRVVLIVFSVILVSMLVLTAYLYIDRDHISRKVLTRLADRTQGELSFSGIAFNPFIQFPQESTCIFQKEN